MTDVIRIGAAATALGVSIDTLRRWERDGRIRCVRRGQQRYLESSELGRLLAKRAAAAGGSARNRLEGVVLAVRSDGVMAQIELACGPHRVVSVMPREAAEQLDLKPGDSAAAVLRPAAVVVERA